MLRRLARWLWKCVKWTLLTVITLFVLAVAINWRDEPLSDEARALLAEKPVKVPDRENIFVAIAGLDAQQTADVFEAGRKKMEKLSKESELESAMHTFKEQEKSEILEWRESDPQFDCELPASLECLHLQKGRLAKTLAANETLISRYITMQDIHYYSAPSVNNVWLTTNGYASISKSEKLLISKAILDIEVGNTKEGLAFFGKDMALWRRVLENKSGLVDSMIARAWLLRDAQGLSLLLASPATKLEGQEQQWRAMLMPLSHEQYSLHLAIKGEIRYIYSFSLAFKKWTSYREINEQCEFMKSIQLKEIADSYLCSGQRQWLEWLNRNSSAIFYQPIATFNYIAPSYTAWLKLTDLSWSDYMAQHDEILSSAAIPKHGINLAYNPIGKNMPFYPDAYDDYVKRLHNGDTYLRLVRLQLELRLAKIPYEQVPAFLAQLNEPYCAPCSDFSWDAQTHTLSFKPYAKESSWMPSSAYLPDPNAQGR